MNCSHRCIDEKVLKGRLWVGSQSRLRFRRTKTFPADRRIPVTDGVVVLTSTWNGCDLFAFDLTSSFRFIYKCELCKRKQSFSLLLIESYSWLLLFPSTLCKIIVSFCWRWFLGEFKIISLGPKYVVWLMWFRLEKESDRKSLVKHSHFLCFNRFRLLNSYLDCPHPPPRVTCRPIGNRIKRNSTTDFFYRSKSQASSSRTQSRWTGPKGRVFDWF